MGGATLLSTLAAAGPARAATFTVNSTSEPGVGGCPMFTECTLREAVQASIDNGDSDDDLIRFSVTGTINLQSALPEINTPVTIRGPGARSLIVRASGLGYHLFEIDNPFLSFTQIEAMTLADADARTAPITAGGAIYTQGSGNTIVDRVHFSGNKSAAGGAIYNAGSTLDVRDSTIVANISSDLGGGIYSSGNLGVTNSTITQNNADTQGGGIAQIGGFSTIESSTIARNLANADGVGTETGGGTYNNAGTATIRNTLYGANNVAPGGSTAPNQCSGSYTSNGYNLRTSDDAPGCSGFTASGDIVNPNPMIGALSANGGQTLTIPLLPGSPAIDAGNPDMGTAISCPEADQRGLPRFGPAGRCDIGAFEVQRSAPSGPSGPSGPGAAAASPPSNAFTFSLRGRTLTVNVSSSGTVEVADAGARAAGANAIAAGRRRLKTSSTTGGPGAIEVRLRLTKAAKRKLRRRGKIRLNGRIAFTPNGGTANTQTSRLKIRRKRR